MKNKKYYCPVEATVDVIGGKWKARILWHLYKKNYRYGDFLRLIPEISKKMLTQVLRELEVDGLIFRTEYQGKVLKVVYSLTDYGRSLSPLLTEMSLWGQSHMQNHSDNRLIED